MRSKEEIRDKALRIKEQMKGVESGIAMEILSQRLFALAWVLNYPEMPELTLSDNELALLECF